MDMYIGTGSALKSPTLRFAVIITLLAGTLLAWLLAPEIPAPEVKSDMLPNTSMDSLLS